MDWSRREKAGRQTIWLLEEPESYLHPNLAKSCHEIIDDLSKQNCVVITTHSISFIGQDPAHIYETAVGPNGTLLKQCRTYSEATSSIRKAIGLRYSDFFQLGSANIFVEGVSDREILTWALNKVKPNKGKNQFPLLRSATIMDFTGVSSLKDFLKHSYDFIRNEVAIFVVFDGDDAGVEATDALNGFFTNKSIPFNANKDYAVLPKGFAIEGLFPQEFIKDLNDKHPSWFRKFNADIHGNILGFSIRDGNKSSAQRALMAKAEEESEKTGNYVWAKEFVNLFQVAEKQLETKIENLGLSS
ncbi:ATP-dependent nuclease [Duganella sp. P38]|uniref:ATP-dependent nuclease n=1 Tax=Duganella sp. P38 TaxID=3423949 RepID=UPI003D7B907B